MATLSEIKNKFAQNSVSLPTNNVSSALLTDEQRQAALSRYQWEQEQKEKNQGGFFGGLGYVFEKIGLGFLQSIEGIWDYTAGGLADLFGAHDWAEKQIANDWVNYGHADEWFNPSDGWRVAGDVAGGIGTSLPALIPIGVAAAITYFSGGTLTPVAVTILQGTGAALAGLGAAGTGTKEAYQETGQLTGKEWGYGALTGATEAGMEFVSSAIGAGTGAIAKRIGESAVKEGAKQVGKQVAGAAVRQTLGKAVLTGFLGEAFEEGVQELIDPVWKRITYDPNAENATFQQVAYAALIGGLSGAIMSGADVSIRNSVNYFSGSKISGKEGGAKGVISLAETIAQMESTNNSGVEQVQFVVNTLDELKTTLKKTNGEIRTPKQKMLIGILSKANTAAPLAIVVNQNADAVMADPETTVKRLADIGYTTSDGQTVTVEMLKKGVTGERGTAEYRKSLSAALKTNEALRAVSVMSAAGQLNMDAARFSETTLRGENLANQADLNHFVETATEAQKRDVGQRLGIADWSTVTADELKSRVVEYSQNGGLDQYITERNEVEKLKKLEISKKGLPKYVGTITEDGAVRYKFGDASVAIVKNGDTYLVYDYANDVISKPLSKQEANRVIKEIYAASLVSETDSDVQNSTKSQQTQEIDTFARENIPDYKKIVGAQQQAVRKTLRQARAAGLSEADQILYGTAAARSGVSIDFVSAEALGANADAGYDMNNGRILVNREMANNPKARTVAKIILHEFMHGIIDHGYITTVKVDRKDKTKVKTKTTNEAFSYFYDVALKGLTPEEQSAVIVPYIENHSLSVDEFFNIEDENGKISVEALAAAKLTLKDYLKIKTEIQEELAAHFVERELGSTAALQRIMADEPSFKEKLLAFLKRKKSEYSSNEKLSRATNALLKKYRNFFNKYATQTRYSPTITSDTAIYHSDTAGSDTRLSIQNIDGKNIVVIDTDQHIFEGVTDPKELRRIARNYILDNFRGDSHTTTDGKTVVFTRKGAKKITNTEYLSKIRISTELNNFIKVAEYVKTVANVKNVNPEFAYFDYYRASFVLDGKRFECLINVGVNTQTQTGVFYEVTQIKEVPHNSLDGNVPVAPASNGASTDIIADSAADVKPKSDKKFALTVKGEKTPSFSTAKEAREYYSKLQSQAYQQYKATDPLGVDREALSAYLSERERLEGLKKQAVSDIQKENARKKREANKGIDNEYLSVVKKGDIATAQRLVNEAAEKAGYLTDVSWRMTHSAPNSRDGYSVSLDNLRNSDLIPQDFFTRPEQYCYSPEERASAAAVLRAIEVNERLKASGKDTSAVLTVYRAVDKTKNTKEGSFRNGDWVTPSREYAVNEGLDNPDGYRIIAKRVKISELFWNGDSIAELGYDDGKTYAYADTENNRKLLDPITYDDDGNIIPLSKRFNKRNSDVRYALSVDGEQVGVDVQQVGKLVALHNLSEAKLLKVLELGGFPMPSIAITKVDLAHENYGDITVVFGKDTISPTDRRNKVYPRDAWTPTVPKVDVKFSTEGMRAIESNLTELVSGISEYESEISSFFDNIRQDNGEYFMPEYDYTAEDFARKAKGYAGIMAAYLSEKGVEHKPVYKEKTFMKGAFTQEQILSIAKELGITKENIKAYANSYSKSTVEETSRYDSIIAKLKEEYTKYYKEKFSSKGMSEKIVADLVSDIGADEFFSFTNAVGEALRSSETQKYDRYATQDKLYGKITDKADFEKWLFDKISSTEERKGVDNYTDVFTPSGKRRSFAQRHNNYTAENIVKIMLKGDQKGQGGLFGHSAGSLSVRLADEFTSIESVREASSMLQVYSEDEYNAVMSKSYEMVEEIVRDIDQHTYDGKFNLEQSQRREDILEMIAVCADVRPITPQNILGAWNRQIRGYESLGYKFTTETARKLYDCFLVLKELPTRYFEAKPRRVVSFSEIKGVLVPETVSEKLTKQLKAKGIPYTVYSKTENARTEAIKQMGGIRFALTEKDSQGKALTEAQRAYFDGTKVVDEDGNLLVVYHQTNAKEYVNIKTGQKWSELGWRERLDWERKSDAEWNSVWKEQDFYVFDNERARRSIEMPAFFFSPEFDEYHEYGERTIKAYLRMKNPAYNPVIENAGRTDTAGEKAMQKLIEQGYDGFVRTDENGKIYEYAVFESNQIKLTSNKNPTVNPDIRYALSSVNADGAVYTADVEVRYALSKETLDFLNNQETIKVYRAMQVIDGELYPPMAAKVKTADGKKQLVTPSRIGEWEQSVERPDLIKNGKFELDKANGSSIAAAYNPYFHTSLSPLNDQFSSAYKRDNLVVVEGEVPSSELTSGYKAQYAKDSVGETKWHSGVVSSKLKGEKARRVILSRWFKPVRIVSDAEVAGIISETLRGENIEIPYNVVTPQLRQALESKGVKIRYALTDINPDADPTESDNSGAIGGLTRGQRAKFVANNTKFKVYSKMEAASVIDSIIAERLVFDDGRLEGALSGKNRAEVIEKLFTRLNSTPEGYRIGVALNIADYIINNAVLTDMYETFNDDSYAMGVLSVMRHYMHGMDLRGIQSEIQAKFDKKNTINLIWGAKEGGIAPDVLAQELQEYGIRIEAINEADQFFEMLEIYESAREQVNRRAEKIMLTAYGSQSEIEQLRQEIARDVLTAYDDKGSPSKYSKLVEKYTKKIADLKKDLSTAYRRNTLVNRIVDGAAYLRDIATKRNYVGAEVFSAPELTAWLKQLSKIKYRSDLRKSGVRKILLDYGLFYNESNTLLYDSNPELNYIDQNVIDALNYIRQNALSNKPLSMEELQAAAVIIASAKHLFATYDQVIIDGRKAQVSQLAAEGNEIIKKSKNRTDKSFFSKIYGLFNKIIEPRVVIKSLENFNPNGILTRAYNDITRGETEAALLYIELTNDIDTYLKKQKGYKKRLASQYIKVGDAELTVGQAISLYELSKRPQAKEGLYESGFSYIDKKGSKQTAHITEADINTLFDAFTDADKGFIELVETFFNVASKQVKTDADMQILGYTNASDEFYYPIKRDSGTIAKNITDARSIMADWANVYNFSFNKDVKVGAKNKLFVADVYSVVTRHAKQLSTYAKMTVPLKNFSQIYAKNIGTKTDVISIRNTVNEQVWGGAEGYLSKLFSDIQGRATSDSLIEKMRGAYAKYQLGANLKVIVSQITSYPTAGVLLDTGVMAKGFVMKTNWAAMDKYCPYARVRNYERGIVKAEGVIDKVGKVGDVLTKPIQWTDRFTIGRLWNACQLQIQKDTGLKFGTVENMQKAGVLLEDVIRQTQPNYTNTERSELMRSDSDIVRSFTMFTSVPLKQLSRLVESVGEYNALRSLIKSGDTDTTLPARYKLAKKKLRRTLAAVTIANLMYVLVGQFFKFLYNNMAEDDETGKVTAKSVFLDMLKDFGGTTVGMFPVVRDIYGYFVNGYEINSFTGDMLNSIISSSKQLFELAQKAASGEKVSTQDYMSVLRNSLYAIGQVTGLPIRNINNTITGLIKRFSPSAAYSYTSLFYNPKYSRDIKAALKKGDYELAETVMSMMLKDDRAGALNSKATRKLIDLYDKDYSVLPKSVGDTIKYNGEDIRFTEAQQKAFKAIYSQANAEIERLIDSLDFATLPAEQQAKAIRLVYDAYYAKAQAAVLRVPVDNRIVMLSDAIPPSALAPHLAAIATIESDTDRAGNTVNGSKKAKIIKYVMAQKLSTAQKLLLIMSLGYTIKDGDIKGVSAAKAKSTVARLISNLSLSRDEKTALAIKCGLTVKNGRIYAT